MASSFVPSVHDILQSLVGPFLYDQVEAIVEISRTLSWHSFAMNLCNDLAEHFKHFMPCHE
jgi:lipoate-protein ligase B